MIERSMGKLHQDYEFHMVLQVEYLSLSGLTREMANSLKCAKDKKGAYYIQMPRITKEIRRISISSLTDLAL